jgi:hypothetical protein
VARALCRPGALRYAPERYEMWQGYTAGAIDYGYS